jgi:hypothetical protein
MGKPNYSVGIAEADDPVQPWAAKYAYVKTATGLAVVAVSRASAPVLLGLLEAPELDGAESGVALDWARNPWTVLTMAGKTFAVLDVSVPATPTIVKSLTDQNLAGAVKIELHDGTAFLNAKMGRPADSGLQGQLVILSYGFGLPVIMSATQASPYTNQGDRLALAWPYLFLSPNGWHQGHSLWDVRQFTQPLLVSSLRESFIGGGCYDVVVRGRYAYLGHDTGDFSIFDIGTPTEIRYVGWLPCYSPRGISVYGDYAYVCGNVGVNAPPDSTKFAILDVSDPRSPRRAGGLTDPAWADARGLAYWRGLVYLVSDDGSLTIMDVADPAAPHVIGRLTDTRLAGACGIALGP